MKWFRFFHDSLDDPKIQSLSGSLYKSWGNLLCLASKQKVRGTLPPVPDIAFRLRMSPKETQSTLDELTARFLVDKTETGYRLHDWDEWQGDRSSSAERQKRYRERHGNAGKRDGDDNSNVTRYGHVTSPVTSRVTVEEEGDREKNPQPPVTGGSPVVPEASPPIEEDEPFNPPGVTLLPAEPRVANDPKEVAAIAALAERLFPMRDFGPKVQAASGDVPMAHMRYALEQMGDAGKSDWRYLGGILRRIAETGPPKPKAAPPAPRPRMAIYEPIVVDEKTRRKYENARPPGMQPPAAPNAQTGKAI